MSKRNARSPRFCNLYIKTLPKSLLPPVAIFFDEVQRFNRFNPKEINYTAITIANNGYVVGANPTQLTTNRKKNK